MASPSERPGHDYDLIPLPPDYPGTDQADLPRPRTKKRSLVREGIDILVLVVIIYTLVNLLTARFIVDGASMLPSFETGQFVLVSRVSYLFGEPERGDVIVFRAPDAAEIELIKRIIGLPGETVTVVEQQVLINGTALEEPYLSTAPSYNGTWTLGPDEYFVLGDNRNNSRDSHSFGALTRQGIIGQASIVYWPPKNWSMVQSHTYATDTEP